MYLDKSVYSALQALEDVHNNKPVLALALHRVKQLGLVKGVMEYSLNRGLIQQWTLWDLMVNLHQVEETPKAVPLQERLKKWATHIPLTSLIDPDHNPPKMSLMSERRSA